VYDSLGAATAHVMTAKMVNAIPTGKYEPSWFWCHLFPSWQTKSLGRIVRTEPGEMCELLHTSPVVQKNDGLAMPRYGKGLVTLLRAVRGGADAADR
jgi:hypothetical protein